MPGSLTTPFRFLFFSLGFALQVHRRLAMHEICSVDPLSRLPLLAGVVKCVPVIVFFTFGCRCR